MASTGYNFTYNGFSVGPGTGIPVTQVQGLEEDLPNVRSADLVRAQEWGSYAGLDLSDVRDVTITMFLRGATPDAYDSLCDQVRTAFVTQAAEAPLTFSGLNGVQKRIMCRPRKRSIPRTADGVSLMGTATVMLEAMDPRIYSDPESEKVVGLSTGASSGIKWPITWPITWGATVSNNYTTLTNVGSVAAPWVATITGPVVNPVITNATTGQTMAVTITLGSNDVLELDFGVHTITLNGTASRRGLMVPSSSWWMLPPGNTNIYYSAAVATASSCTCTWRSAWA